MTKAELIKALRKYSQSATVYIVNDEGLLRSCITVEGSCLGHIVLAIDEDKEREQLAKCMERAGCAA